MVTRRWGIAALSCFSLQGKGGDAAFSCLSVPVARWQRLSIKAIPQHQGQLVPSHHGVAIHTQDRGSWSLSNRLRCHGPCRCLWGSRWGRREVQGEMTIEDCNHGECWTAIQVLDVALEEGCTFWDTADVYFDSEDLLGKWCVLICFFILANKYTDYWAFLQVQAHWEARRDLSCH